MRFTLAIILATGLAFAGLAVFIHERAAAQQAAEAGRTDTTFTIAAEPPAAPPGPSINATAAPPSAAPRSLTPATGVFPAPQLPNQSQANYFFPGYPVGPNTGLPGVAAATADPETQELTSQDQQLEAEVQSLARQLADAEDEKDRADLKQQLAAALEKQFDAQQKLRELEISRIETRVQKLRDLVRKRTDSRRKIIDNRYEQLLNDAEGLGWNSASASGAQYAPYGGTGSGVAPYGRGPSLPGGMIGPPGSPRLPGKK